MTLKERMMIMRNDPELLRQEPIIIDKVFEREKRRLHELYKLLKAGLISPQDIPQREKRLLRRYYGMDTRQH